MIRNFILLFLVILFGSIIIVFAFNEGWIRIVIDPNGLENGIDRNDQEIFYDQKNDESIDEYFIKNRLFDIIKHRIEPGETLFDIENRYETNWKVLQKLNKIDDPIRLQPGKIIWVPVRTVDS